MATNINFTASGNQYVGTFQALKAVKIQIEMNKSDIILIGIKDPSGTDYDDCKQFNKPTLCVDFKAEVYPTDIRITCGSMPTLAKYQEASE